MDTIHAEENKHCIICHQEQAVVIFHPTRNKKKHEYGFIEVICKNENCKSEIKIPLEKWEDPAKVVKHAYKQTEKWW